MEEKMKGSEARPRSVCLFSSFGLLGLPPPASLFDARSRDLGIPNELSIGLSGTPLEVILNSFIWSSLVDLKRRDQVPGSRV